MNKTSMYILIAVIAVVAAGLWFWRNQPVSNIPVSGTSPQGNAALGGNDTASINQNLNNIILNEPDFKSIDNDLNLL